MDKKNKTLYLALFLVMIYSIFMTYKRSFFDKNFITESGQTETDADTADEGLENY